MLNLTYIILGLLNHQFIICVSLGLYYKMWKTMAVWSLYANYCELHVTKDTHKCFSELQITSAHTVQTCQFAKTLNIYFSIAQQRLASLSSSLILINTFLPIEFHCFTLGNSTAAAWSILILHKLLHMLCLHNPTIQTFIIYRPACNSTSLLSPINQLLH